MLGGTGDDTQRTGDGDDTLNGNEGNDVLCAASGNDWMRGQDGNDILWGGDGNDDGAGGDGNDLLTGGNGNDTMSGCYGDDILLSRSDAGEPEIAAAPGRPRVFAGMAMSGDDQLGGAQGADLYRFELLVNARPSVVQANLRPDGRMDWAGVVAGPAPNAHDWWVDGIGTDTVKTFNRADGDRIEILGWRVEVASIRQADLDRDGQMDSVIALRAMAGGPNGGDALGTIRVMGAKITAADVTVRSDALIGAFDTLEFGQFPGDRFGTLPFGFTGLSDVWTM